MNINEFINKFYMDDEYKRKVIHDLKTVTSQYDPNELLEHQATLDSLHYKMLFDRINDEIFSKTTPIKIKELGV